jgi:hypothetical protein
MNRTMLNDDFYLAKQKWTGQWKLKSFGQKHSQRFTCSNL